MSIRLRLGPADIVSARFAISPLWEVGNAVRLLTRPELSGYHEPWLASVQPELDSVDLSAVMALHPPGAGWVPDFMTPPPRRVSPTVEQQLAEVARTPLQFVTSELERARPGQTDLAARAVIDELLADPAAGLARVCAQLAEAWRVLVAPSWPRIRELVAADLAHRARIMAAHGFGAAVDDLHARVRWTGDAIAVQDPARVEHVVAGAGLILQPSAFSWPAVIVILDAGPAILVYPARGVAVLWRTGVVEAPVALARLLGPHPGEAARRPGRAALHHRAGAASRTRRTRRFRPSAGASRLGPPRPPAGGPRGALRAHAARRRPRRRRRAGEVGSSRARATLRAHAPARAPRRRPPAARTPPRPPPISYSISQISPAVKTRIMRHLVPQRLPGARCATCATCDSATGTSTIVDAPAS